MIPPPMLKILFFLLLALGWMQLFVSLQNRLWSYPWPKPESKWVSRCYQAGVIISPLIAWLGVLNFETSASVRTMSMLPQQGRWCIIALGAFGLTIRGIATARWWLQTTPSAVIAGKRTVNNFDSPECHGGGPLSWMLSLPGNESLKCEFVELELAVSGLPENWNDLKILHLTDPHFRGGLSRAWFENVFEAAQQETPDLIVFTGDLLDHPDCIEWIETTFGRLSAPCGCYFILGNHDAMQEPDEIRSRLRALGWIDVSQRVDSIDIRGEHLEIAGDETPWMGTHPAWESDKSAFRLLLSHSPDNFEQAAGDQVDLVLSGHTHGGQIVLPVVGPLLCPSRFGTRYAAGQFQHGKTVLHVSRGMSGKEPIRWNCLPEVTTIRIRSAGVDTV